MNNNRYQVNHITNNNVSNNNVPISTTADTYTNADAKTNKNTNTNANNINDNINNSNSNHTNNAQYTPRYIGGLANRQSYTTYQSNHELCVDEDEQEKVKTMIQSTFEMVSEVSSTTMSEDELSKFDEDEEIVVPERQLLEQGWEKRANSTSIRRNAEV